MSGHHPFSELKRQLLADPSLATQVDEYKRAIESALALGEMRRSRGLTQKQVAEAMHVTQANISRIERGEDAQISTVASYIRALGGDLELRAVFPDSSSVLSQGKRTAS